MKFRKQKTEEQDAAVETVEEDLDEAFEAEEEFSNTGKIKVSICGRKNGLLEYDNVSFVRVKSKNFDILIMEDYLPTIGKIEGSVSFRNDTEEYEMNGILGYFMHKNNHFSLMLKEEEEE